MMKKCIKRFTAFIFAFALVLSLTIAVSEPQEAKAHSYTSTSCMHIPYSYYEDISYGGLPRYCRVDTCYRCGIIFGRAIVNYVMSFSSYNCGGSTLNYLVTGKP